MVARTEATKEHLEAALGLIDEARSWVSSKSADQWAQPWPDRKNRDARIIRGLHSVSRDARRYFLFFHEIAHSKSQPTQSTSVTLGYAPALAASNRRKRHARPALSRDAAAHLSTNYSLSVRANKLYAALIARLWQSVMIAASIIISMVIGAMAQGGIIVACTVAIICTIMSHRHRHEPADESLSSRTSIWVPCGLR